VICEIFLQHFYRESKVSFAARQYRGAVVERNARAPIMLCRFVAALDSRFHIVPSLMLAIKAAQCHPRKCRMFARRRRLLQLAFRCSVVLPALGNTGPQNVRSRGIGFFEQSDQSLSLVNSA